MTATLSQPNTTLGSLHLVDDRSDPQALQSLRQVLREARFDLHVSTMKRGLAEAILRQHPDLVLLVSSGPAALKLCQQIKKHDDSPLVVVVLNESPPANWTGFTAGVDDFVVRPLNPKELVARLSMSLRSSRQRTRLVSDNRGLEAQLAERNRDLERALLRAREVTVLKDSIVSTVSHEMRTPLLQVKSSLAMLAEDLKQSPESTTRLLNYASQAVARLESTVNNITQLAASLNLRREPFSVTDAVNQAIRQLRRMWESSHGIDRIRPLLPDDLPLAVGDRGGTAQVLQQLIDNALKFSPDGGPVEVIAEVVEDGLRLTVRDHGIGIQADQMDKIFQAFYQVDGSSTRHFGGAGIGLAIAKLILDGMETSIDAFSQVGEGSAFSFVLPSHTGES